MVESNKCHWWLASTYMSPIMRNGEFLLVNGESCKAFWSGFKIKHTKNNSLSSKLIDWHVKILTCACANDVNLSNIVDFGRVKLLDNKKYFVTELYCYYCKKYVKFNCFFYLTETSFNVQFAGFGKSVLSNESPCFYTMLTILWMLPKKSAGGPLTHFTPSQ